MVAEGGACNQHIASLWEGGRGGEGRGGEGRGGEGRGVVTSQHTYSYMLNSVLFHADTNRLYMQQYLFGECCRMMKRKSAGNPLTRDKWS